MTISPSFLINSFGADLAFSLIQLYNKSMGERNLEEHGLSKYPWQTWTDGNEHTIQHGKDYHCAPQSMQVQLSTKARTSRGRLARRNADDTGWENCSKAVVHRSDGTITFKFLYEPCEDPTTTFYA
jgi:hypothetical protein